MFTDIMLSIEGKKCFRLDRSNGIVNGVKPALGGGLVCYVDNKLATDCAILESVCTTSPDIELLTVQLDQPLHKIRYIYTIYRPPDGNVDTFYQNINVF